MSRHSSMGSYQQPVYNYPLSEQYLKSQHSQAMIPEYSNRSFASTSSGSYDSNAVSCLTASPLQYDHYEDSFSAPDYATHNSQGDAYDTEMCIDPLYLLHKNHVVSRHSYQNQRIVPSSDHGHIAEYDASNNKFVPPRRENRHRDDRTSKHTEKDNTERVACKWEGCNATFSRKADVNRHFTSTHEVELIDCDVNNCARKRENGFARKDHLLEHKRGYHCMDIAKRNIKSSKGRHDC